MTRHWRALAALVLLSSPLAAQVAAGRAARPLAAHPLVAPPIVAPSLAAAAPALAVPSLANVPPASAVAAPTAARAWTTLSAAAANSVVPAGPGHAQVSADSPAGSYGQVLFDGSGWLFSRQGAVFLPVPETHPAVRGSITLRQYTFAPQAEVRPVPGTEGLSGKELLEEVGRIAARDQKTNEWEEAKYYIFKTADHVTVGGVSGVVDAYSGTFVPGDSGDGGDYAEPGDEDGDGYPERDGMNVEHTWPQSLFKQRLPMRADVHHLMATFQHPNSVRGSLPFGEVKGKPDYSNKAGAKRGDGRFEPPDITKGRVARSLLYFYARYKDHGSFGRGSAQFWNAQIQTMLRWNRQFPPDVQEMRHNDLVEKFQGNRNPFVDDPGLADRIGAEALRTDPLSFPSRRFLRSLMRASAPTTPAVAAPRSDVPRYGRPRRSVKPGMSRSGRRL